MGFSVVQLSWVIWVRLTDVHSCEYARVRALRRNPRCIMGVRWGSVILGRIRKSASLILVLPAARMRKSAVIDVHREAKDSSSDS